jgi:sugar fermentation stimulation protein A
MLDAGCWMLDVGSSQHRKVATTRARRRHVIAQGVTAASQPEKPRIAQIDAERSIADRSTALSFPGRPTPGAGDDYHSGVRLPPLTPGRLIRRYKRFLADVELEDGSTVTVHCPNSGSMKGCLGAGWAVRLSSSGNPKRKYKHTWEMVHDGSGWIAINTSRTNLVVEEGIRSGVIPELAEFDELRREVRLGEDSRIDLALLRGSHRTWVEVKNVTMVDEQRRFAFPDAVTTRGTKHLRALSRAVTAGDRAFMLYLIPRSGGRGFAPADAIDPEYGRTLRCAVAGGVEILAYRAAVSAAEIRIVERVPVQL